jgi:hypothetical protein
MRYGLLLLPDLFLLVALLRMTRWGMAAQRREMFFFLCAWLVYSFVLLFLGQLWPIGSYAYNLRFFLLSLPAWLCAAPALWIASRRFTLGYAVTAICVCAMAVIASRFVVLNLSMSPTAKLLALNCWASIVVGSIFLMASRGAEGTDLYLWRCCGIFFLLFGYGYLAIGLAQPGEWAMRVFVLAGAAVWCALAYYIGPRPEHLFNLEKLGVIWPLAKACGICGIPIPFGGRRR